VAARPSDRQNGRSVEKRVEELRRLIAYHAERYHRDDAPEIADAEYDEFVTELRGLESEHPELKEAQSPSESVGAAPASGFATVRHAVPMMSLDNVFSLDELIAWDARITRYLTNLSDTPLPRRDVSFDCEPKIDWVDERFRTQLQQRWVPNSSFRHGRNLLVTS
jgi:DNA ligase (NAD+)